MMNICYNGSFNGFWAECNVMRPRPMASASLEPSFGQEDEAHRPHCKVGV